MRRPSTADELGACNDQASGKQAGSKSNVMMYIELGVVAVHWSSGVSPVSLVSGTKRGDWLSVCWSRDQSPTHHVFVAVSSSAGLCILVPPSRSLHDSVIH